MRSARLSFNPRPCARGDLSPRAPRRAPPCFNPRPCARGDGSSPRSAVSAQSFNPRPCARGDSGLSRYFGPPCVFQSTPLREGRPSPCRDPRVAPGSFNPRPCARGDGTAETAGGIVRCFNPRPCARGDKSSSVAARPRRCFNPRPCARGDAAGPAQPPDLPVSIHAPARGATTAPSVMNYGEQRFNPRPCARGDDGVGAACAGLHRFQSTPLREGRPPRPRPGTPGPRRFNPRPCARGDAVDLLVRHRREVSIHAPARGATPAASPSPQRALVSIHAPARGATTRNFWTQIQDEFQSTPLREGRRC